MLAPNGTIHKCEASWDDVLAGHFPTNPVREASRQAVADVAEKARQVLTESHGRIDQAVKLVLAGDVQLHEDGTATVGSQSDGGTQYTVNGECGCKDFPKAPGNFCKHKLAMGICKRATTLLTARLQQVEAAIGSPVGEEHDADHFGGSAGVSPTDHVLVAPLPEAPASCNVHVMIGMYKVQVTLRDRDETRLLARLKAVLAQFPTAAAPEPPQPAAPAQTPTAQPTCRYHGSARMNPSKYGGWVCSMKLDDASFCNQRWPKQPRER